jgi:hypothetical protein
VTEVPQLMASLVIRLDREELAALSLSLATYIPKDMFFGHHQSIIDRFQIGLATPKELADVDWPDFNFIRGLQLAEVVCRAPVLFLNELVVGRDAQFGLERFPKSNIQRLRNTQGVKLHNDKEPSST